LIRSKKKKKKEIAWTNHDPLTLELSSLFLMCFTASHAQTQLLLIKTDHVASNILLKIALEHTEKTPGQ